MKLTNARGSRLVRLGPDDVVNDFANPIQLVTLTADNAWHDFDFSGYEIMVTEAPPRGFVKVNFSNAENGFKIYRGRKIRLAQGFAGCRLYLGNEQGNGGTIEIAISRVRDIELPASNDVILWPEVNVSVNFGLNLLNEVMLESPAVVGGLYDIQYNVASNANGTNGYGIKHLASNGVTNLIAANFWYMGDVYSNQLGVWNTIKSYPMRAGEKLQFYCSDDSGPANTTNFWLIMNRHV